MNERSKLSAAVRNDLATIEPSLGIGGPNTSYFPCMAILKDGKEIACACFIKNHLHMSIWGVEPEHDPQKKSLRAEEVAFVVSSPFRLPPAFANRLYADGESGMGYMKFVFQFRDGSERAYLLGNLIDFIFYPAGQGPDDVVNVLPHRGRGSSPHPGPEYFWCLYDE